MTFELLVFSVIATVAIAVLTLIVMAIGLPFGMGYPLAVGIAAYIFVVIIPGVANLWIAATGSGGEDATERVTAGVRGIAIIAGWTSLILFAETSNAWSAFLPYLVAISIIMFIWSIWREGRHHYKN